MVANANARALVARVAPSDGLPSEGPIASGDGLGVERLIEIQRARILAAMVDVCAERGTSNVTVANIVQRAGVSRRTFYEIFTSREDCFLAAFDDGIARASRYISAVYGLEAEWLERVRTAVAALLQFLDAEQPMGELLLLGSLGMGTSALERRQRVLAQLVAVVDEGREGARQGSRLPPLTAEGIVGGALAILHARIARGESGSPVSLSGSSVAPDVAQRPRMVELAGSLTSMIVLPYRGATAAQRELHRPVPEHSPKAQPEPVDPLRDLEIRLTYRTVRVLIAVAERPGASNREVADAAGIADQGQTSKLLARLDRLGLVQNTWATPGKGAPNSWVLTNRGHQVERAMSRDANPQAVGS